ncbi:g protein-coupled receptor [Anaeramoeba flamelloides]|uniref:G protein-coupled receptor n=1 Tax=Anaeramoeba flamelloides TaxID=1746091 RepID=A0ABQ8XDB6_9EUKA|nr:g protein-coupled receptor [Anaeramoeba flamelloides]
MKTELIPATIGSLLGFFGAIIMITFSFFISRQNFYLKNYVNFLSILDCFAAFFFMVPVTSKGTLCTFQICVLAFSVSMSVLFSATITVYILLEVVFQIKKTILNKVVMPAGITLTFVICFTILITILKFTEPGPSGNTNWCWTYESWWNLLFYIILWLGLFICLISSLMLISFLFKKRKLFQTDWNYKRYIIRWAIFPLVLFLIFLPATIKRMHNIINSDEIENKALDIFQAIITPTQGFFDLIIFYIYPNDIRKMVFQNIKKKFSKKKDESFGDELLIPTLSDDEMVN